MDVKLAGGFGDGEPEINHNNVWFNGVQHCGHTHQDLGIAWASKTPKNGVAPQTAQVIKGQWFAGMVLDQRTCGGDCSHETFHFPRILKPMEWQKPEKGKYFQFCKTAFKPYDLAVNVFLVIAKHYLKSKLKVTSDGTPNNWIEAVTICKNAFGYDDFKLD